MKLIHAMNELKLTERKLDAKNAFIKRYAARPSIREDSFGGQEKQKVAEAYQAAADLIRQHEKLKKSIDYTNLMSATAVNGSQYTLHSLILHKRVLCKMKKGILMSLDDREAYREIEHMRSRAQDPSSVRIQVVANFDILDRDAKRTELDELESSIDSALQIANSKLELLEPPAEVLQKA